jgi:hypothetical protein
MIGISIPFSILHSNSGQHYPSPAQHLHIRSTTLRTDEDGKLNAEFMTTCTATTFDIDLLDKQIGIGQTAVILDGIEAENEGVGNDGVELSNLNSDLRDGRGGVILRQGCADGFDDAFGDV